MGEDKYLLQLRENHGNGEKEKREKERNKLMPEKLKWLRACAFLKPADQEWNSVATL